MIFRYAQKAARFILSMAICISSQVSATQFRYVCSRESAKRASKYSVLLSRPAANNSALEPILPGLMLVRRQPVFRAISPGLALTNSFTSDHCFALLDFDYHLRIQSRPQSLMSMSTSSSCTVYKESARELAGLVDDAPVSCLSSSLLGSKQYTSASETICSAPSVRRVDTLRRLTLRDGMRPIMTVAFPPVGPFSARWLRP